MTAVGINDLIRIGDLEIDTFRRLVTVAGRHVVLQPHSYKLLLTLAMDPERVFTKEELTAALYGEWSAGSRKLDSAASRLRRKLGNGMIQSVWGVGYRLLPFVDPEPTDRELVREIRNRLVKLGEYMGVEGVAGTWDRVLDAWDEFEYALGTVEGGEREILS